MNIKIGRSRSHFPHRCRCSQWYQFSTALLAALRQPTFVRTVTDALQLHKRCVEPIQDKINAITMAEIAAILCRLIKGTFVIALTLVEFLQIAPQPRNS